MVKVLDSGLSRSELQAGERKWAKQERAEELRLQFWVNKLKAIYSKHTPKDLLMGKDFKQKAQNIHQAFVNINAEFIKLMQKNLLVEKKFKVFFGDRQRKMENLKSKVENIIARKQLIKKEFKEIVEYWSYLVENKKLPSKGLFWGNKLAKFNNKPIKNPLEHINFEEISILAEMHDILEGIHKIYSK